MTHAPDRVVVDATQLRAGRLRPPVSKSDAQRALTLADALGRPALAGLADEEAALPTDVFVLGRGLRALRDGNDVTIDCADGGAPLRILLGQAAARPDMHARFVGSPRLGERPHEPLLAALRTAGVTIERSGTWPIVLRTTAPARSPFLVQADESSQFATSLLLAAAALVARSGQPATVAIGGPVASSGYLELTLRWLDAFGFRARRDLPGEITIESVCAPAVAPPIPGDWSSIAYLLLVAWRSGSTVERVDRGAPHPDREILSVLDSIGVRVTGGAEAAAHGEATGGLAVSGRICPDLLPTLAALACALPAPSTLSDVSILRHKESDRLDAIEELVRAGGGRGTRIGDALRIDPGVVPRTLSLRSRGDHRIAMAAAVLAVLGRSVLTLEGAACVAKSFPGFWRALEHAGVTVTPAPRS